jgi:hypothetical protein
VARYGSTPFLFLPPPTLGTSRDMFPADYGWHLWVTYARLNEIPGVERSTLASVAPLSSNEDGKRIVIPGFVPRDDGDLFANVSTVAPEYFATFGIPLLRGRAITVTDADSAPHVAVIGESESLLRRA